jgi:transcriptional regulator with XRE-family HTH domain
MRYRLKEFMDNEGLNAREFSERMGVQASSVSHILTGRNKPSVDFLEKALESFPNIDLKYLITGKKPLITSEPLTQNERLVAAEIKVKNTDRHIEDESEFTNVTGDNEVVEIVKFYKNGTFKLFRQK